MASMLDEPALLAKLNGVMGGPPSSYDERKITAGVDAPGGGSEKKPASANALARPDFQLTCSANGKFVDDPYDCCSYTAKVQVFPNGTRKQVCVAGPPASAVATTKSPQRMALDAQFAKNAIREKCLQDIEKLDKSQRDEETKANSELMHSSLSPSPASVTTSEGAPISICTSVGCMSENTQCAVESGGYITCTAGFDMSKGFSITQSQSGYNLMYDDKYCRLDATRQVVCDSSAANAEAFHITSSSPSTLAMTIFDAKNSLTRFCNVENNRFTCNSTHDKTDFGFRIF